MQSTRKYSVFLLLKLPIRHTSIILIKINAMHMQVLSFLYYQGHSRLPIRHQSWATMTTAYSKGNLGKVRWLPKYRQTNGYNRYLHSYSQLSRFSSLHLAILTRRLGSLLASSFILREPDSKGKNLGKKCNRHLI